MLLETEIYGRHCWQPILEFLVPYCLWHQSSAPRTNCMFLLNTSCFRTEHMEAYAYRCKDPGQSSSLTSCLTNRGFQQVRGKVHQHKDPVDEMLPKVTHANPPSPSPSFSESAPWRQPEKSSDHTRDAWSSTYSLARGLVTVCTLERESHSFGLDWIKSSFSVLNWRKKRGIYAIGIEIL